MLRCMLQVAINKGIEGRAIKESHCLSLQTDVPSTQQKTQITDKEKIRKTFSCLVNVSSENQKR